MHNPAVYPYRVLLAKKWSERQKKALYPYMHTQLIYPLQLLPGRVYKMCIAGGNRVDDGVEAARGGEESNLHAQRMRVPCADRVNITVRWWVATGSLTGEQGPWEREGRRAKDSLLLRCATNRRAVGVLAPVSVAACHREMTRAAAAAVA